MENKGYSSAIKAIIKRYGGYREKAILCSPHMIERSETWNNNHKVLYVTEINPQPDGYRNGFAVDIITQSICG